MDERIELKEPCIEWKEQEGPMERKSEEIELEAKKCLLFFG